MSKIAVEMSDEVWELAADGQTVTWAIRRMRLGDELFRRVWPDAPIVAP